MLAQIVHIDPFNAVFFDLVDASASFSSISMLKIRIQEQIGNLVIVDLEVWYLVETAMCNFIKEII